MFDRELRKAERYYRREKIKEIEQLCVQDPKKPK